MRTYRELFSLREFRALFLGTTLSVASSTMGTLGLSGLVYAHTGSPFLSSVAFLAGFLPYLAGAMTLGALTDRVPPRLLLAGWPVVRAVACGVLASGALSVPAALALVMVLGYLESVPKAVALSLVVDLLPGGGYVLGRSTLNLAVGAMQVAGFGGGGLLMGLVGPYAALWAAAGAQLAVAAVYRVGLRARPPRAAGELRFAEAVSDTWRGNKALFERREVRGLLFLQWVPNGLIVGAEALYVPYAGDAAGALFACSAAGMFAGDLVVGRWTDPARRLRLAVPLYTLLALPFLAFALRPGPVLGCVLVGVACFGFAGHLGTQERYLDAVPDHLRGQAMGLASAGMQTHQALAATLTGAVAEFLPVPVTMALAGAASLAVSGCLRPHLTGRPAARPAAAGPAGGPAAGRPDRSGHPG
ncbi:MFS transporter [Streptomyces sp. NPDC018031]|uniref:MFS transporter n=1 Tax=Streptomyces sp. NPDC018031 TaxID=3365033 RepID=UPI00379C9284